MNRRQRIDAAVQGVLGPVLRDYGRGVLSQEQFDKRVARSANAIRDAFRQSAPKPSIACSGCALGLHADQAAVIAGNAYCERCAPKFRKAAPPRRAA